MTTDKRGRALPIHNVRIRPEIYKRLSAEAMQRDQTITNLLNNILEDHYRLEPSPTQRARRHDRRSSE